jgi:hypothetical protein
VIHDDPLICGELNLAAKLSPVGDAARGEPDSLHLGSALPNQVLVKFVQVAGKFGDDIFLALLPYPKRG